MREKMNRILAVMARIGRSRRGRSLVIGVLMLLTTAALMTEWRTSSSPSDWVLETAPEATEIPYSEMRSMIAAAKAGDRIAILPFQILFAPSEGEAVIMDLPNSAVNLVADLVRDTGGEVTFLTPNSGLKSSPPVLEGLMFILPMMMILGFMAWIMLASPHSKGGFRVVRPEDMKETLDDIAGIDELRGRVRETIRIIRDPSVVERMGGKPPRGMLVSGPPGTGKTMLARAIAKEAGVSFMSIDASGLNQIFMGVGGIRVKRAFAKARKMAPCVIFIDEIDAIGSRADFGGGGADQDKSSTINAFLVELDGISPDKKVFVIGATNLPDRIDPALIRPGRIDRRIHMTLPDRAGRVEILTTVSKRIPLSDDVDLARIAGTTPGFSGADLAMICNEAVILAGSDGRSHVTAEDFSVARKRRLVGENGAPISLHIDDRETVAWHESGHAVMACLEHHADPLESVTIIPGGGALGFALQVPERDKLMETKSGLESRMMVLAAGRAAEVVGFGEGSVTNGAAQDIHEMTRIATGMVTKWGMGSLGFVEVSTRYDGVMPQRVTTEITDTCNRIMMKAQEALRRQEPALRAVVEAILEKDTLSGAEVRRIVEAHRRPNDYVSQV